MSRRQVVATDWTRGSGMENPPGPCGHGPWSIRKANTHTHTQKKGDSGHDIGRRRSFIQAPGNYCTVCCLCWSFLPVLAHGDGASMQTLCALHEILLIVNGNTLFQAALGQDKSSDRIKPSCFVSLGGCWGNQWNQSWAWPSREPSTPLWAAPAGSASKRWQQHSAVSAALYSVQVLCKHSLISLPTPPEGRQLTGFYFKSPAMWRG